MTQHAIAYVDGRWQCYATEDGIARRNEGPRWDTPRQAAAFIDRIASMPEVSPLRAHSAPNERTPLGGDVAGSSAQSEADRPLFASEAGDGFTPTAAGLWDLPTEAGGG